MEGKGLGISSRDLCHNHHNYVVILSLNSQVNMRLTLHSVLATKIGQAPAETYTEHMKHN